MKKLIFIISSLMLLLASTDIYSKMEWVRILYVVEDGAISKNWEQMDFINDSVGVVLVSDARYTRLDKTTDAGITWHTIYDERTEGMLNVSFDLELLDNGDILIAFEQGMLKFIKNYYIDSKKDSLVLGTYSEGEFYHAGEITHLRMIDENYGIASTGAGIFYTDDCWQSYEMISPDRKLYPGMTAPTIFSPDTIAFVSGLIYTKHFVITTDRGKTWTKSLISESGKDYHIYIKSCFLDNMTGFLIGGVYTGEGGNYYDLIKKTTDAGKTWRTVHFGTGNDFFGYVQDIDFKDRLTGMAVAQKGTILRTSDGGENWEYEERIDWGDKVGPWSMHVAYCGDTPLITGFRYGLWRWQDSEPKGVSKRQTHNIKSYPNPFEDNVNIEFPPSLYGKYAQIQILDAAGTVIEQGNFMIQQGGLVFRNEDLAPGTYFCRVYTLQNFYTIKLMKK